MRDRHRDGREEGTTAARFHTSLARSEAEIREAQQLRYRVFLAGDHARHDPGVDRDRFDGFCEHLLVRDRATQAVVGTYRILGGEQARQAGGFYSESEFDLGRILAVGARIVELGRACVDPAYRTGSVIARLLAGVTAHVVAAKYDYVIGCASVSAATDLRAATHVCRQLLGLHLGPDAWRVYPHRPFAVESTVAAGQPTLPPLIKAYLRLGAVVCGTPAWDPVFQTADLLMMLPLVSMAPRYRARLLRRAA
jgi:putative hemolysin